MQGCANPNHPKYSHTQKAPRCLMVYAFAVVFIALGWFAQDAPPIQWLFPTIGPLMLVLAASFHHLSVEDLGNVLAIRFGPIPLFRRTRHKWKPTGCYCSLPLRLPPETAGAAATSIKTKAV